MADVKSGALTDGRDEDGEDEGDDTPARHNNRHDGQKERKGRKERVRLCTTTTGHRDENEAERVPVVR
jgi:hypothetical protein